MTAVVAYLCWFVGGMCAGIVLERTLWGRPYWPRFQRRLAAVEDLEDDDGA